MSGEPRQLDREEMIARQLRFRGIRDPRVLEAFARIPRHEFVPRNLLSQAYDDSPLPIGDEQTISQPYIVARMTEMLDVHQGHRILEIGTGSGYQTAVLRELTDEVYTIEVREALLDSAKTTLALLGYAGIHFRLGDGAKGWPEAAPFDRIIGTACATEIPPPLVEQLAVGGRLVLPLGPSDGDQRLVTVDRGEDGAIDIQEGVPVRFVMMTS